METMTGTASEEVTNVCRNGQISETVVTTVAEAKGVDPLDLEPLYAAIDPDALNSMFRPSARSTQSSTKLEFSVAGCDVVVHGNGEVAVTRPAATDASQAPIPSLDD